MTSKNVELIVVITANILQIVNVQMMFPAQQGMFMMPAPPMAVQVMPPPPPVGVPVPYPVPVPVMVTKKTTTTTKAPAQEEKDENNNNMMVFGGNPFAPPVIVMPVPSSNVRKVEYDESSGSSSKSRSDDSSDSSDSSRSALRTRKKHKQHHIGRTRPRKNHHLRVSKHGQKHHKNHQKQLRSKRNLGFGDPGFVKPVLTYLSKNGNVKFKRKISGNDVAKLMGEKKMHTDDEEESSDASQYQPLAENSGLRLIQSTEKTRGIGTLPDRRISNLSVSYRLY